MSTNTKSVLSSASQFSSSSFLQLPLASFSFLQLPPASLSSVQVFDSRMEFSSVVRQQDAVQLLLFNSSKGCTPFSSASQSVSSVHFFDSRMQFSSVATVQLFDSRMQTLHASQISSLTAGRGSVATVQLLERMQTLQFSQSVQFTSSTVFYSLLAEASFCPTTTPSE